MDYIQNTAGEFFGRSRTEDDLEIALRDTFKANFPVDTPQWNHQFQVYLKRHNIMRILYYNELYQKIIGIPGDILDFGVHYGASTSLLLNFRGIYEPYNVSRRIWAFDTFEGLRGVVGKDPNSRDGSYSVPTSYENVLQEILGIHEGFSPVSHLQRFGIVKGDARQTFRKWLDENPGTLISLLHLDMDLFEPTAEVLELAKPRLTQGSLVVLDELTAKFFPGEAEALMKVVGVENIALRRSIFQPYCAWYVV
jgi:hypothetical protein